MRKFRQTSTMGILIGVAVLFGLGGVAVSMIGGGSRNASELVSTVVVERGVVEMELRERGLVRPTRVVPIQSEISSNQARIIWLHEEGAWVNKGLVVARFDTKPFTDILLRAEQEYSDVQARLAAARKALDVQREETASRLERTDRELEIARIKAEDLRHGTGQLERERLLKKVNKARRAEHLARQELDDFDLLLERGFVSQRERDTVADRKRSAVDDLHLGARQLANFDRYEMPRKLREAEVIIEAAEAELARVQRVAEVELRQREGEVVRQERALAQAESQLEDARGDVARCDVHAPVDGVLLYKELPRPDGHRKIQIGDDVWIGQTFMEIPDTRGLAVEASIREVDVAKIRVGMDAEIRLDAFGGKSFQGTVESIDSVAEADESNPYMRRFRARVRLDESAPGVYVGMSAEVRIVYRRVEDVARLPIEVLSFRDAGPMVRVREGQSSRWVPVELGLVGTEWAQISAGVHEGQVVEAGDL